MAARQTTHIFIFVDEACFKLAKKLLQRKKCEWVERTELHNQLVPAEEIGQ